MSENDSDCDEQAEELERPGDRKIAYLRYLEGSGQCELRFHFDGTIENVGAIKTDIRAVRQSKDSVDSLLDHIKNKLINVIKTNDENKQTDNTVPFIEFTASLSRKNGGKVKGKTCCKDLIHGGEKKLLFNLLDHKYCVVLNAPLILQVNLPVVIYCNYAIQPTRFKAVYMDRASTRFTWYKSLDKVNWVKVGDKYNYKTSDNDVNHFLKFSVEPKNRKQCPGEIYEVISENPVETISTIPPKCPFEERHLLTNMRLKNKSFRIVSYNTLSDRYNETNEQFPYCPPQALAIDYRKQLILKEILGYNADIMCLQEVDFKVYLHYFKKELKNAGFGCSYHKKGNRLTEGLACIYRLDRFKVLESTQLVLSEQLNTNGLFSNIWSIVKENKDLKEMFLKQATSLQVTILKLKQLDEILVIANTHLYYHSQAYHIRLIQVAMVTTYLNNIRNKLLRPNKCRVSVVLCGDLNSMPDSGVYHLITNGNLPHDREDYQKITFKRTNILQHPFVFGSACGTPEFTNYTLDFKACLDYIFYDKTKLAVERFIPFPEENVLSEHTALPSIVFPSDHVALIADMKFL